MFFRCEARSPPRGWVCAFSSSSSPSSSPSTSASHSGCSSLSALTWSALASFHFVLETYYGCKCFNPLYQSGGGPLTFVPGGLKIEGSTQVIFSEPWCLHTHVILNTDATKGCWRLGDRQADLWDPKAHLAWRQVRLMTLNVNQQISCSPIVERSSCDIAQQPGCVRIRPINSDRETKHRAQVGSCPM